VSEHAFPSSAKSAERIEGAIIAGGAMAKVGRESRFKLLFGGGERD
jgi:hypothetical protein